MTCTKKHLSLAIISGILLATPWLFSLSGFFMFVALIPLLYIEDLFYKRSTPFSSAKLFLLTHIAFLIWNILALWWIMKFSFFAGCIVILLNSFCYTIPFWLFHVTRKNLKLPKTIYSLVFFWCAFEFLYLNVSWALPGLHLGNAFYKDILFIQWYEYTGILGGTCWIILVNILLYKLIDHLITSLCKKTPNTALFSFLNQSFTKRKILEFKNFESLVFDVFLSKTQKKVVFLQALTNGLGKRKTLQIILPVLVIFIPPIISAYLFQHYQSVGEKNKIMIIQPNIDPYKEKFNGMGPGKQLDKILHITRTAITKDVNLIVCPETALADTIWLDSINLHPHIKKIRHFLKAYPRTKMIIGAEIYKTTNDNKTPEDVYKTKIYNAALQIDTSKNIATYYKEKLIPGVEHHLFPGIVKRLAPGKENLFMARTPGKNNKIFPDGTVPLICYESLYGKYAADYTVKGAKILIIITNDGWFGNTQGYRYHLGIARIRAIESRRSIARSANTGVSALINPKGQIIKHLKWNEAGAISADIQKNHQLTFYAKHGDYLGWICLAFTGLLLMLIIKKMFEIQK